MLVKVKEPPDINYDNCKNKCSVEHFLKHTDSPEWFDPKISNYLSLPLLDNYKPNNKRVNFGDTAHDREFNSHFSFKNVNNIFNFPEIKKENDDSRIKALKTRLSNETDDVKRKSLTTSIKKKELNIDKTTIAKKITIYPTNDQVKKLKEWFDECTRLYNKCVDLYNSNNNYFDKGYQVVKTKIFNEVYGDNNKPCPYDILTDEIRAFCSNLKSCKTNKANGNIHHFEFDHKKFKRNSICIFIPKTAVKKGYLYKGVYKSGSIYKNQLKSMKGLEELDEMDIENDCRINFIKDLNRYELIVPINVSEKNIPNREEIVALDPGEKIFMAYFSQNGFGKIGDNIRNKILAEEKKIRRNQRILSRKKNKEGNKLRNKCRIIARIRRRYRRINNIVKELHNKTALFLCKNYKRIFIPKFETQNMVSEKKKYKEHYNKLKSEKGEEYMKQELRKGTKRRRLSGKVKFVLNMLSHYKFRQHLINKSNEYGCQVFVVTEEYTSKTCTKCGEKSDKYTKREKRCDYCHYSIDRDINGARNILMKNVKP